MSPLAEYRKKRDFRKTREPSGVAAAKRSPRAKALQFVIQKHHASHLHFDLRLEVDGVMRSWAVPKGPSRDPKVKRLAMQVEDHPMAYNAFEGTIPKGQYGGGTVMIWDRGTYTSPDGDENDIREALEKGRLKFTLAGDRLEGTWTLVRTRRDRQWLLIKHSDEHDVTGDHLSEDDVGSVVSDRRMSEIAGNAEGATWNSPKSRAGTRGQQAKAQPQPKPQAPSELTPMLASVATSLPSGDDWVFEPKYDGIRVLAFADGDAVALFSRNGIDKAAQFPEIVEALSALSARKKTSFVLDGEIVARKGKALGRFQDLQQRIGQTSASIIAGHAKDAPATLVTFDVLLVGGDALIERPWTERREHLEALLGGRLSSAIALGDVETKGGEALLDRARRDGWEGVMAKRADAAYTPGKRSKVWLKVKVEGRQEFVVGGWTEPRGSRKHLGALLIGYWRGDDFVYAGRVGTGFTADTLRAVTATLRPFERKTSPFADDPPRTTETVHWAKPEVVVEVKFNEWTADGRLRQPVFLGVRDDKASRSVVREAPAVESENTDKSEKTHGTASRKSAGSVADQLQAIESGRGSGPVTIPHAGTLPVTNLSKAYFPAIKKTKGDVLRYYDIVAPALLPLIVDRPLVLKRYPDGVDGYPFFQQNAPEDPPDGLRVETVPSDSSPGRRIVGDGLYTLLYCAQLGCIDVNPWHSRVGSLQCPDYTILDLDPGPKATFATVVRVARVIRELLQAANLTAGVKTSGSRGLHIVIPLPPRTNEEASLLVAQILAEQTVRELPQDATTIRSRDARPAATIYVDYLQNIVGKSVASAFSIRPRPNATVSTPLSWDEITGRLNPDRFTIDSVVKELDDRAKLWTEAMSARNRLDALVGAG